MKILITGGSGFIGTAVMRKLLEGNHSVIGLSRSAAELAKENVFKNVQWVNSSLQLAPGTLAILKNFEPEVIIHLAWEQIPDFSFETSLQNLQNQVLFFKSISSLTSVKKIIVAGSCFEYNRKTGKCLESDECISSNYFTWAKNSLRDFLQVECLQKNIIFAWVRIFYVYGPNQRKGSLIPTIIQDLLDGKVPELKKPANANDFIYVDDVAEGFKKLAEKNISSGVYNLGSGRSTEVTEVLRIVGKNIRNGDEITNSVTEAGNSVKAIDFWADMKKTGETLDWKPVTSLEDGIRKMINSF